MSGSEATLVVSVEPLQPAEARASLPAQRDSDRALAYWLQRTATSAAGDESPFLDFAVIETEEWRQRFLMSVDDDAEGSVLLLWGSGVAALLEIPAGVRTHVSISRGIPDRYRTVFVHGCAAMRDRRAPVRVEAQITRSDGRCELVRASFIPIIAGDAQATRLAFGTINRKVI